MPIAHGEGCYFADDATLDALEADGGVLFRYVDAGGQRAAEDDRAANPNGSCGRSPASSTRPATWPG